MLVLPHSKYHHELNTTAHIEMFMQAALIYLTENGVCIAKSGKPRKATMLDLSLVLDIGYSTLKSYRTGLRPMPYSKFYCLMVIGLQLDADRIRGLDAFVPYELDFPMTINDGATKEPEDTGIPFDDHDDDDEEETTEPQTESGQGVESGTDEKPDNSPTGTAGEDFHA
jgi:hypothetical protein